MNKNKIRAYNMWWGEKKKKKKHLSICKWSRSSEHSPVLLYFMTDSSHQPLHALKPTQILVLSKSELFMPKLEEFGLCDSYGAWPVPAAHPTKKLISKA